MYRQLVRVSALEIGRKDIKELISGVVSSPIDKKMEERRRNTATLLSGHVANAAAASVPR